MHYECFCEALSCYGTLKMVKLQFLHLFQFYKAYLKVGTSSGLGGQKD